MKFYEKNLFLRLSFTLAIIFFTILIMVAWWQMLFDKTLNYYVISEKKILETEILRGMHREDKLLLKLLEDQKIFRSHECKKDICVSIPGSGEFYEIHPDYEKHLFLEKKRKLRMFYSETSFLIFIVLVTIAYMAWVISREKKIQSEKQEFLTMTTHELKHPVSVLSLLLESLSRDSLPKERTQEFLHKGMSEIKTLKRSLENLLKLQELSFSKPKNIAPYDLCDFVKGIIANWDLHELNKNGRLICKTLPDKNMATSVPPGDLQIILNNLIENALLYSKDKVELSVSEDSRGIFLEVKDQGLGFNEDDKKNFQKMFFRSRRHDIQNIRGSGLGHYIIKKLLEKNSLHLTLESEGENKGSKFKVYLK